MAAHCRVLEGLFACLVQLSLAMLAMATLWVRRAYERPKRPVQIWMFDVSKQAIGAAFVHSLNLILAYVFAWYAARHTPPAPTTSGSMQFDDDDDFFDDDDLGARAHGRGHGDECMFYAMNFLVDTVFGMLLAYALLELLQRAARRYGWRRLAVSGYYGSPPSLRTWLVQLLAWLGIIVVFKTALTGLLLALEQPLAAVGNAVFRPLQGNPELELLLVMIIFPGVLNLAQFWIQDGFLKYETSLVYEEVQAAVDESPSSSASSNGGSPGSTRSGRSRTATFSL